MREQWTAWEQRSRRQAQDAGSVIIADIDKPALEATMGGVYQRTLTDADLRALVERIRTVP